MAQTRGCGAWLGRRESRWRAVLQGQTLDFTGESWRPTLLELKTISATQKEVLEREPGPRQRKGALTSVEEQFLCNQSLSTSAGARASVHMNEGSAGRCLPAGGRRKQTPYSCGEIQELGFNTSFCKASKMKTAGIGAWAGKILGSGSDRAGIFLSVREKVESHQR